MSSSLHRVSSHRPVLSLEVLESRCLLSAAGVPGAAAHPPDPNDHLRADTGSHSTSVGKEGQQDNDHHLIELEAQKDKDGTTGQAGGTEKPPVIVPLPISNGQGTVNQPDKPSAHAQDAVSDVRTQKDKDGTSGKDDGAERRPTTIVPPPISRSDRSDVVVIVPARDNLADSKSRDYQAPARAVQIFSSTFYPPRPTVSGQVVLQEEAVVFAGEEGSLSGGGAPPPSAASGGPAAGAAFPLREIRPISPEQLISEDVPVPVVEDSGPEVAAGQAFVGEEIAPLDALLTALAAMRAPGPAQLPVTMASTWEAWAGSIVMSDVTAVLVPARLVPLAEGELEGLEAFLAAPVAAVLPLVQPEGEGLLTDFQPASFQALGKLFHDLLEHLDTSTLDLTAWLSPRPLLACALGLGAVAASELLRRQRQGKEEGEQEPGIEPFAL